MVVLCCSVPAVHSCVVMFLQYIRVLQCSDSICVCACCNVLAIHMCVVLLLQCTHVLQCDYSTLVCCSVRTIYSYGVVFLQYTGVL